MTAFDGKRFVVTGAASGIGNAVAERLLAAGAGVVSLDRNTPTAKVSRHIEVDLANPRSIDAALEQLDGRFDGLMNVAGIPGTAPADMVLAVNSLAVRQLTEAFLERLAPGGSVTTVSSTAGFGWPARLEVIRDLLATDTFEEGAAWFKAHPQQGNAYNFSKEVTTVYTMTMGLALVEMGFRINAVLPGPVETRILADFEESMGKDNLDGVKELLGRHADPADIAARGAVPRVRRSPMDQRPRAGRRRGDHRRCDHRSRSGARDLRSDMSIQASTDHLVRPGSEPAVPELSGLRQVFATGRTRGLRWRLSQLDAIERGSGEPRRNALSGPTTPVRRSGG